MMQNVILVVVLVAILGLALFAVYRSRKRGKKCIGCPGSGSCSGGCGCGKESNK